MNKITLAADYTRNGEVCYAKNVPHEATEDLQALLDSGVEGVATDDTEGVQTSATSTAAAD